MKSKLIGNVLPKTFGIESAQYGVLYYMYTDGVCYTVFKTSEESVLILNSSDGQVKHLVGFTQFMQGGENFQVVPEGIQLVLEN